MGTPQYDRKVSAHSRGKIGRRKPANTGLDAERPQAEGGWSEGLAEKCFAGGEDVLETALEIACVPGVCYVAAGSGAGHQQMDFALWIGGDDAADPAQVAGVHTEDAVEAGIIGGRDGAGGLGGIEADTVLGKATSGRRVDRVSIFLIGNGGGFDVIAVRDSPRLDEGLHNEFSHRAATDIPMTYEEDAGDALRSRNFLILSHRKLFGEWF